MEGERKGGRMEQRVGGRDRGRKKGGGVRKEKIDIEGRKKGGRKGEREGEGIEGG